MPVEGAILGLSTVTCAWSLFWGRGQDLGIVTTNDGSHAVHTAVAALDIVPVEQLMVPVMFREMLVHKREELPGYVSRDVLVEYIYIYIYIYNIIIILIWKWTHWSKKFIPLFATTIFSLRNFSFVCCTAVKYYRIIRDISNSPFYYICKGLTALLLVLNLKQGELIGGGVFNSFLEAASHH